MAALRVGALMLYLLLGLRGAHSMPLDEHRIEENKNNNEDHFYIPEKLGEVDAEVFSLLRHFAAGSAKLRERVEGNEGLLVLQDSGVENVKVISTFLDSSSSEDGESQSSSDNGNAGGIGGDVDSSNSSSSFTKSGMGDALSSGSGLLGEGEDGSAGETEEEKSSSENTDSETETETLLNQWLDEELQRMTTVVYDCSERRETVGDWRDETRLLVAPSHLHTNDSMHKNSTGDERESEHNERIPRFIFDEDTREFVTNSSQFPQCAIARTSTGCTAFFISPYHALTAAHCVNNFRYGWRRAIRMWRGRNCHKKGFHNTCSRVFAVLGHTQHKLYDYDYALIEMSQSGEPAPCWFGIGYINPWEAPSSLSLEALGYPVDKRRYTGQPECSYEAMWLANCNQSYSVRQNLIQWCDLLSGNSGSPVFAETEENKVVYGVHAQSVGDYTYAEDGRRKLNYLWNQGPMITPLRYFQILRWMSMFQTSND